MNDFNHKRDMLNNANNSFGHDTIGIHQQHTITQDDVNHFMRGVFWWMFMGLLLTTIASLGYLVALMSIPAVQELHSVLMIVFVIAQFGLVITLSAAIHRLSAGTARMLYILYSVLTGFTLSSIFIVYVADTIFIAFGMAALFFAIMAIFGYTTESDLTSMGRILFAGLIAMIIAMVVNFFIGSDQMTFFISIAGVAIFSGLTAYHVQRIKSDFYHYASQGGVEVAAKLSILGALSLYLAFLNLFLSILRLLGRRN